MADAAQQRFGLDDAALAAHPTIYAPDSFDGQVVLVSGGAGGIGLELTTAMKMYDYGHLSAIIICIIVLVTLIDQGSALIRKRLT